MRRGREGHPKNADISSIHQDTPRPLQHSFNSKRHTTQKRGRDFPIFLLIKIVQITIRSARYALDSNVSRSLELYTDFNIV